MIASDSPLAKEISSYLHSKGASFYYEAEPSSRRLSNDWKHPLHIISILAFMSSHCECRMEPSFREQPNDYTPDLVKRSVGWGKEDPT